MAGTRPWMPLYVADYLADTAHLNAAQSGAYLHLIMHYWQTGGLPDDDAALCRIARMTAAEWRRSRDTIRAFFRDGWRHKRIDEELAHAMQVSSKRRASAQQRHSNSSANADANAEQKHTHARTCAGASPSPSQSQKKDSEPEEGSGGIPPPSALAVLDDDPRTALFKRGLTQLMAITGRGPDSCRSLLGKWLKMVSDEAIHVLAAIDDAHRERVANPVPWINARLQAMAGNGARSPPDRPMTQREKAASNWSNALGKLGEYAGSAAEKGGSGGEATVSLLPPAAGRR